MSAYFPELSDFDDTKINQRNNSNSNGTADNKRNKTHLTNDIQSNIKSNQEHFISDMIFPAVRTVLWYDLNIYLYSFLLYII